MNGGKPAKDSDEKRFNETLKRMLKTPPKREKPTKNKLKGNRATSGKTDPAKQS